MGLASLGRERDVVLLGSTGSIGTQAADIVRRNPDRFRLIALAAGGGKPDLLASQALEFGVEVVAVASERAAPALNDALQARARESRQPVPKVLAGPAAVAEVAAWPSDVVLRAVTVAVGLAATLSRGAQAGPDRQRRPVPALDAGANGQRDPGAGTGTPDLEHGSGHHHQLGHAGQ